MAADSQLALIQKRGTIIIGVKTDYPPFGMLNAKGESIGFEHDLAADIAKRLHVNLRKVGVNGANRLMQLNDGRVDLVIATMGDTAERRDIATLVEPNYYSSGVTIMTPPDTRLKQWSDLRGQTVCATQGSYFNRTVATRYLLDLQLYGNGRDAKLAVRDRRCVGWIFDNTAIAGDLLSDEWRAYRTPLPPQWITPWAMAIARSEKGGALEHAIGDIVADWHRSGYLIELEKKWHLPVSEFLQNEHKIWSARDASGAYVCHRNADGDWPVPCRNPIFVTSADVDGLLQVGLYVKEKTGIDLVFLYDAYERRQFLQGVAMTLGLTLGCVLLSLGIGIALAFLVEARIFLFSALLRRFMTFSRMTPPLLQMYVLLFGVGSLLYNYWRLTLEPVAVAIVCLSCYTGSTVTYVLLAAADARRELKAANDSNANKRFRLTRKTLKPLIATCSTPICAALINVSKATMLASAIAVPDLLLVSMSEISEHGNTGTVMNTVLLIYLLMIYAMTVMFRKIDQTLKDA